MATDRATAVGTLTFTRGTRSLRHVGTWLKTSGGLVSERLTAGASSSTALDLSAQGVAAARVSSVVQAVAQLLTERPADLGELVRAVLSRSCIRAASRIESLKTSVDPFTGPFASWVGLRTLRPGLRSR